MSIRPVRISASRRCSAGRSRLPPENPTIVIAGFGQYPALVALAADEGLAGFALRRQRIEFLLEPFLGGFAGVDRAALAARVSPSHCCPPSARRLDLAVARSGGRRSGWASTRRRVV